MSPVLGVVGNFSSTMTKDYAEYRERALRIKTEATSLNRPEAERKHLSRHTWDICEKVLPRVDEQDAFQQWPDGHCKFVYSALDAIEAGRHMSGWAMRNTNNHNALVLKKSCLGVLVCSRPCVDAEARPLVHLRPAICDKARAKQMGKACPTTGCGGRLQLKQCEGHGGYPVTHFWRTSGNAIYFQSKGVHSHPRPVRFWPLIERRQRTTNNSSSEKNKKTIKEKKMTVKRIPKSGPNCLPSKVDRHFNKRSSESAPYVKIDCNYPSNYSTTMTSYPVTPCDIYRPMIENRTRPSCHFEAKTLPHLDPNWIHQRQSPSPPQGHFWLTHLPEETASHNFPSCEYQSRNEPMEFSPGAFLPFTNVEYLSDCNGPYHITTPVKQEIYHPDNSMLGYSGHSPEGLNSSMSFSPSNGCVGAFFPPDVEGYRSLHQSYSPESHYYVDPHYSHHRPSTLYGTEMVSPFFLDALTAESTLSELDPVGVEEELRNLAQSSTDSFEHQEMLSVSSRLSCKEECSH